MTTTEIAPITPDNADYDAERTGFQTLDVPRPDLVFAVIDSDDVVAAVEHARDHDLPLAVRATGHGMPATPDGGVLITTSRLDAVEIDPARRTARIEAGATWAKVIAAAAPHGLAPLSGSAPGVGAASYTLGGGVGLLARTHGYAADHVLAIDVVTPDGELRHVTDGELFWALRGGRANFGVVVAIEVALFEHATILGGGLYFPAERAREVFAAWKAWTGDAPETLTTSIARYPCPPAPFVPKPLRGHEVVHVRVADTSGDPAVVAPMRALGGLLMDTVAELAYADAGSIYAEPTEPSRYVGDHVLLDALEPETIDTLLAGPREVIVEVRHLGGAMARAPRVDSAVGHRDKPYMLGIVTPSVLGDLDAARADHAALMAAISPWTDGARALNFLAGEQATVAHVRDAYEPADYARLQRLKAQLDPANLLRHNHNIPPA